MLISIYLTIAKYDTNILVCPESGVINCQSVITSQYSDIFGIPTSILGLILFILALIFLFRNNDYKFLWTVAGAAAVIYSLVAQALLAEICIYCLSLDLIIVLTAFVAYQKDKTV